MLCFSRLFFCFLFTGAFCTFSPAIASESIRYSRPCEDILLEIGADTFSFVPGQVSANLAPQNSSPAGDSLQEELKTLYRTRSFNKMAALGHSLTREHHLYGNSFQTKNPKTGRYDHEIAVNITPWVAPIPETQLNAFVESTEPVLQAMRRLLQIAYSQKEISPQTLELEGMAPEKAQIIVDVLKNSIYFEPKLVHPSLRDYPFLAVSGFDAAIGDPQKISTSVFEINAGTPSGLSNNIQILQALKKHDPQVWKILSLHMAPETTFTNFRQVLEEMGMQWTGVTNGLVVQVGPGEANGAHPDVAAISRYSGIPLVKASDLYQDENGSVRLNTGSKDPLAPHPVVTVIYNRTEDITLLSNERDGIPLVNPALKDQSSLEAKFGVKLRAGVEYEFELDERGEAVGLKIDGKGQPKMKFSAVQMGRDPKRPQSPPGSFAQALLSRRLAISGFGGRRIDDKRLLPLISEWVKAKNPTRPVVSAISGLDVANYSEFYQAPEKFVVKPPENSGGVGIYFMNLESPASRAQIVQMVKDHPREYRIERLSSITTVPKIFPHRKAIDHVPTDVRVFVFFSPSGKALSGPNAVLGRTAPQGKLFSNTSQGGGYMPVHVYVEPPGGHPHSPTRYDEPELARTQSAVAASRLSDLQYTLLEVLNLIRILKTAEKATPDLQNRITSLIYRLRGQMDLLPKSMHPLIQRLRELPLDQPREIESEVVHFLNQLAESPIANERVRRLINFVFNENMAELVIDHGLHSQRFDPSRRALIHFQFFSKPEPIWQSHLANGTLVERLEYGRYTKVENPQIEKIIQELEAVDGELRFTGERTVRPHEGLSWDTSGAYFWVNHSNPNLSSYLKPIIAVNLFGNNSLEMLSHEFEHFKRWRLIYQKLKAENSELPLKNRRSDNDLRIQAALFVEENPEEWLESETNAVEAELNSQINEAHHTFNHSNLKPLPYKNTQFGYAARRLYPFVQAIRIALKKDFDEAKLRSWFFELSQQAIELRQAAVESGTKEKAWYEASLIEIIFDVGGHKSFAVDARDHVSNSVHLRFVADGTWTRFLGLFNQTLKDHNLSNQPLRKTRFPRALGAALLDPQGLGEDLVYSANQQQQ